MSNNICGRTQVGPEFAMYAASKFAVRVLAEGLLQALLAQHRASRLAIRVVLRRLSAIGFGRADDRAKPGGRLCRRILGIILFRAVETADNSFANRCRFHSVIGFGHARGQLRQLLSAELALSVQLIGKTDHADLFFRIKALDLLDNLLGCHSSKISPFTSSINSVNPVKGWSRLFRS